MPPMLRPEHDHLNLLLDARCVTTLGTHDRAADILRATAARCFVTSDAWVQIKMPDLQLLVEEGLLEVTDMSGEAEELRFVALSALCLHNDDAASVAITVSRGWTLVSDDKRVREVVGKVAPDLALSSISDIAQHWETSASRGCE